MTTSQRSQLAFMQHVYDNQADDYDHDMLRWDKLIFRGDRRWAADNASGDIIELGIGTGLNLPYYPPDSRIIGVDLSARMLQHARQRASNLRRPCDLRQGSIDQLDLPSACADTVVITFVLCNVPDVPAVLREARRILRADGRLVLVEHTLSRPTWGPVALLQRALDPWSVRRNGEHLTRDPLPDLRNSSLRILDEQRHTLGLVVRVTATPASPVHERSNLRENGQAAGGPADT